MNQRGHEILLDRSQPFLSQIATGCQLTAEQEPNELFQPDGCVSLTNRYSINARSVTRVEKMGIGFFQSSDSVVVG